MAPNDVAVAPRINAMTVDVEDYFQVSAFENLISREDWDRKELRVDRNVERILELFARHEIKATFFVLGWVAKRVPATVRAIAAAGHEVASHGFNHVRVTRQGREDFRVDVTDTKKL